MAKTEGAPACSIARAAEIVGEWWTLLILRDVAFYRVHRFDDLQRSLGIARNILTSRLRRLVDAGVLETRLYSERPPRYEYHVTAKGQELSSVLYALLEWGDRHARSDAPPVRVEHTRCGTALRTALTCPQCRIIVPDDERRINRDARARRHARHSRT